MADLFITLSRPVHRPPGSWPHVMLRLRPRPALLSGPATPFRILMALAAFCWPDHSFAAELDGRTLGLLWSIPFAGLLLSVALLPLLAPHFWEHHYPKVSAFWAVLLVAALAMKAGPSTTLNAVLHTLLIEYVPFILLLLALFTVAGGILVRGNIHGSPGTNTALLAIGAGLASLIGTTGASMVMIRPVIRANDNRRFNIHVVIFFIFLVSNIGGSLTPLGDPPLFLGFLRGVDFFWTTRHLAAESLLATGVLLAIFFALDSWLYRQEDRPRPDPTPDKPIYIKGGINFALIAVIIAAILGSATYDLGHLSIFGIELAIASLLRDATMLGVTLVSLAATPKSLRVENGFTWGPIREVARLFAAIFVTIIPVLAILKAGREGALAPVLQLVSNADGSPNAAAYFWLTGLLSSFLDNAPTYLVFFELAGGDPHQLMTTGAPTLAAISAGAVFMGANTYIGNAPNFMVFAIARSMNVRMPGFFGYMLWSGALLIPTFVLVTFVFFLS
jgi:Na+/H+ antiporter NhaD/arsenite permease-like protein